jgi:translocation and assembly module TamB
MRRRLKLLLVILALLGLAALGIFFLLSELRHWGGPALLDLIQDRINGQVSAREISGNPLTGLTYRGLVLRGPQGQVVLEAERLEVRLSPRSITAWHLIVSRVALDRPHLFLTRDRSGRWNVSDLPKAPQGPARPTSTLTVSLPREIHLASLQINGGEVIVTRRGATTNYTALELKASADIHHFLQKEQKVNLDLAELAVTTPQGRLACATRLSYGDSRTKIGFFRLKLAGHPILDLQGELCSPLTALTCDLTGRLGPLQGELLHEFWDPWPAAWGLAGSFSCGSASGGMTLKAQGEMGQAGFVLAGKMDTGAKPAVFDLDLQLQGLTPAQLKEIKGLSIPQLQALSPVAAGLHLEGAGLPWSPARVTARLKMEPFQYREIKVKRLALTLQGDAGRQVLRGQADGNFGAVSLDSRGQLLPLGGAGKGLAGDLSLQTKEFQPTVLGLTKTPGTVLNAAFTGKFRLPPGLSLARSYLGGDLKASGRLGKEPLRELKSSFVLEGGKLTVRRADLQLAAIQTTLSGWLTKSELDVTFAASISSSQNLPLPPGAAFKSLKGEGAVRGPWRAPQWRLSGKVNQLAANGVRLATGDLTASLSGWPPQAGSLQLHGSELHTPPGDFSRVNLSAQGEAGHWRFQMAGGSPRYPQVQLAGAADLQTRPLTLKIEQVSWESPTLTVKNRAPFTLRVLPGWEISPATLQVNGGTVTVQGLARDRELSGRLELQNLKAGLLQAAVQGTLSGQLNLAGSPTAPVIDGRLALSSGTIKSLPLKTCDTTLSYQAEKLRLTGSLQEGLCLCRLTWNGVVPVRISLLPLKFALGEDGLDLKVQSEKADLSLLQAVSPDVKSARGPLELAVEARGNPRQPRVSGYIRWGGGNLEVQQAATPYRLEPGEIRLEGSKVTIPGIILVSDGTLRLTGVITLAQPPRVEARAQLSNFLTLNRGGNEVWTNGEIDVKGPLEALAATGHLVVPKAQFRPTFFRSPMDPDIVLVRHQPKPELKAAVPDFFRDMSIKVALTSPGNVWLRDPIGQVEMTGDLQAVKKPGQLKMVLGGTIRALKGTVDVEQQTFTVERARLTLPGVVGQPSVLEGKATHELDDLTLVLTVTGSLTNPQIRLESLPPLPPADVLSYLVFGAPAATLSRDQYLALGAEQLGVLGGVSTKKLDELLGSTIPFLGGLKVKGTTIGGRPTVGVATEITKNVSVTYGRSLNEERGQYERQVGIEYKVNKHLSVESQIGPRNSGADVLYNLDF